MHVLKEKKKPRHRLSNHTHEVEEERKKNKLRTQSAVAHSIMEDGNGQVTFMFQVGLVRDFITADASQLTLKTLKDLACNFINQRVSFFSFSLFMSKVLFGLVSLCSLCLLFELGQSNVICQCARPTLCTSNQLFSLPFSLLIWAALTVCDAATYIKNEMRKVTSGC